MTLDDIIENFELLDEWDDKYRLLIDLGRDLEPMPSAEKTEESKVRGCASQVWLTAHERDGRLYFHGDSDAHIVKGLVALVLLIYSGQRVADIPEIDARVIFEKIGLAGALSPMRTNGLYSMTNRIQDLARSRTQI